MYFVGCTRAYLSDMNLLSKSLCVNTYAIIEVSNGLHCDHTNKWWEKVWDCCSSHEKFVST